MNVSRASPDIVANMICANRSADLSFGFAPDRYRVTTVIAGKYYLIAGGESPILGTCSNDVNVYDISALQGRYIDDSRMPSHFFSIRTADDLSIPPPSVQNFTLNVARVHMVPVVIGSKWIVFAGGECNGTLYNTIEIVEIGSWMVYYNPTQVFLPSTDTFAGAAINSTGMISGKRSIVCEKRK